jgi:hypothetical protein
MSDATPPAPSTTPATGAPNVQPISYSRGEYAAVAPWNGLAIASLVLSIIGLSLIGVILGHIALSQIKRTGEQGSVLAIVGLVLGYLGLLVLIIGAIVAFVMLAAGVAFWTVYQ